MNDYSVELEISLGNRAVVLSTPPNLNAEEAQRVAKLLVHHGLTYVIRRIEWKEPIDAEYL
jgi:hypothetical protein